MTEFISSLIIPAVILAVGAVMFRRADAFEWFVRGARDGMKTTVSIIPTMTALMVALSMFSASGAADLIVKYLSGVCSAVGIPSEILPLAVTRPISGSAASSAFAELLDSAGPDSIAGLCASVIMGSSDTLIYVIALYFGKTRVKKAGRAFLIASLSALLCLFLSSLLVRIFFS